MPIDAGYFWGRSPSDITDIPHDHDALTLKTQNPTDIFYPAPHLHAANPYSTGCLTLHLSLLDRLASVG